MYRVRSALEVVTCATIHPCNPRNAMQPVMQEKQDVVGCIIQHTDTYSMYTYPVLSGKSFTPHYQNENIAQRSHDLLLLEMSVVHRK